MNQFLHIGTYGRAPKKNGKRHETAVGILNEAARKPSAVGHLAAPLPAKPLFGPCPSSLIAKVNDLAARGRDSIGRTLRSDAGLIAVVVVSYPVPRAEQDSAEMEPYLAWREMTLDWLRTVFPSTLHSVVEHADEAYFHLHAVLIPSLDSTAQIAWKNCHPGRHARTAALAAGATRSNADAAYKRAMSALQEDFHHTVSVRFGHDRVGPRRARRDRHHHLQLAALEKRIRELQNENDRLRRTAPRDADHSDPRSGTLTVDGVEPSPAFLVEEMPQPAKRRDRGNPTPMSIAELERAKRQWSGTLDIEKIADTLRRKRLEVACDAESKNVAD